MNLMLTGLALRTPVEVAEAAREMVALAPGDRGTLYDGACFLARCVPVAADPSSAARWADEAFALLNQAVVAGWNNAAHTATDPDLAPLHDRNDFRRLVAGLFDRIFPADAFAH